MKTKLCPNLLCTDTIRAQTVCHYMYDFLKKDFQPLTDSTVIQKQLKYWNDIGKNELNGTI